MLLLGALVQLSLAGCSDGSDSNQAIDSEVTASTAAQQCVLDEMDIEILVTESDVEFVRTPETCFDDLPDFPYEGKYVEIDGLRQGYVEDGPEDGDVVLLLHGQPSWSYLYRKMIPVLADSGYRVIAMDHLGTGRSDKPTDIDDYTYSVHSDRLEKFITTLGLSDINLFVQDWGSLIGLKVAGENPDWFASIGVGDGTLPSIPEGVELYPEVDNPNEIVDIPSPFENIPEQQEPFYDGCDLIVTLPDEDYFGSWMEYAMKADSFHASEVLEAMTWFPLSEAEEAAYDAPFPSRIYMAGIRKFPSIANELGGQTAAAVAGLAGFEKPFITIWASNDAGNLGRCETQRYLIDLVPGAKGQAHTRLPEASHFLQDDQGEEIARRLLDFYADPAPFVPESPEGIAEEGVGFEILQILSADEIVVWVSRDITRKEFDTLELPNGWRKNEPRETDASAGSFARSPSASEDWPLVEEELFGFLWQQNATIVETGIAMDDEGLLNAAYVAKFHTITYEALSTIYVLVSPTGEEYVRVSRDADRVSEVFTLPEGWRLIEQLLSEPLTLTLPNPTLNIRADNQDSFQGPVSVLRAGSLDTGQDSSPSGPLALGPDL
jgi:pimeloyl-ACP methyl ester carboxylesterase